MTMSESIEDAFGKPGVRLKHRRAEGRLLKLSMVNSVIRSISERPAIIVSVNRK